MADGGEQNVPGDTVGGQGEILPTSDGHHTRADIALVGRAVRQRWGIPPEIRTELPAAMRQIVNKESVTILDSWGVAIEVSNDRERIAAAKVLVAMEGQNQADDHLADKNERIDGGKATEVVKLYGTAVDTEAV